MKTRVLKWFIWVIALLLLVWLFYLHYIVGIIAILVITNLVRLNAIRYYEYIRDHTNFTTEQGKAIIKDLNHKIDLLRFTPSAYKKDA